MDASTSHTRANDLDTHKVRITGFKDEYAQTQTRGALTLAELRARILAASASTRGKLPWLKLATFGTTKTDKGGSLRHDANVISFDGIECDYDSKLIGGKPISYDEAIETVKRMGSRCLIHTSPSHKPAAPRWRLLIPLSKTEQRLEMRANYTARVNGFFGGNIFDPASFKLSQSYFYGKALDNPAADHRADVIDGEFIDLQSELVKYQADGLPKDDANAFEQYGEHGHSSRGFENILAELGDGLKGFHNVLRDAAASYVATHNDDLDRELLKTILREAMDDAPKDDTKYRRDKLKRYRSDKYLDDLIDSAVRKFGQQAQPVKQWPEPIDLWGNFEPPDLRKGLLPPLIEKLAFTEGENMGCDPAGIAMAALTVCAAAIPDAVQLRMKPNSDGWKESPRLWTMLVGDVSAKKTPVLNRTTWPIKKLDSELYRQYAVELEAYESLVKEQQQDKSKQPGQQPKPKPEKPKQQRVRLEDTTIEAAQEVFADSPDGLLCLQDELSGWFGSMDKYSGGGGAKDRGFWLQAYNGGEYIVNRIKRGALYIQNLSACVLGGIQPDKIREYAAEGVDDGLLQRSIPIIMQAATVDRDDTQDGASAEYGSLIEQLNLIRKPDNRDLKFDDAAQKVRRELADKHLALMNCDAVSKKFAAHVGKYDGLFGRLCIVFHCIENMESRSYQTKVTSIISEHTARRVGDFMHDFLLPHAVCFYAGVLGLSDDHESLTKVAEYILANKLDSIDSRTIQRGNRHMRKMKKKDIEDVLDQLDAFGWITKLSDKNHRAYGVVNPKVHRLFEARGKAEAARAASVREAIATAIGKARKEKRDG